MIPDLHQLLFAYSAYVIGAASPGPSNMRIMGVAMHQGRQAALVLAAGVVTGSIVWGTMAATGVSALLTQYAHALVFLKIFGGLYLLYLACKAAKSALMSDGASPATPDVSATGGKLFRSGLLIHLANPKAIMTWLALLALGLGPGASPQSVVIVLSGCFVLSVSIFFGYALIFSTKPMVLLYRRAKRVIEGVLAVFFTFAGFRLLLSRF